MELTIKCRPDGTRSAPRIPSESWETVRPALDEMHKQGITRGAMLQRLRDEYNFEPTMGQLIGKMKTWGHIVYGPKKTRSKIMPRPVPGHIPIEDTPDAGDPALFPSPGEGPGDADDNGSDPSGAEIGPASWPVTPLSHCTNPCCLAMIQCQAGLLAVDFLSALGCYQMACEALMEVWRDISSDASIPLSDKVWMVMRYESMTSLENGHTLVPTMPVSPFDPRVALFLSQHITGREEIRTPHEYHAWVGGYFCSAITSHFWLLCQYRRVGTLTPSSESAGSTPSYLPRSEIIQWESKTSLLNRLMVWCLRSMNDFALFEMMQNVVVDYGVLRRNEDDLDSAVETPRSAISMTLACYYMQTWLQKPDEAIVNSMLTLRRYACSAFDLEVLLPEAFVTIARMCLREVYGIASTPWRVAIDFEEAVSSQPEEQVLYFLNELRDGMTRMCRKDASDYVRSFVDELISADHHVAQVLKPSTTALAISTMQKIVQSRAPTESHPAQSVTNVHWMRVPDCFKLQSRIKDHLEPVPQSAKSISLLRNMSLLQISLPIDVKRTATSSSTGSSNLGSMQGLSSRIQAEITRQAAGVTRGSSNASDMSWQTASDRSFDLVTRFERPQSTASILSSTMQDVVIEEVQERSDIQDNLVNGDIDVVIENLIDRSLLASRPKQLKPIPVKVSIPPAARSRGLRKHKAFDQLRAARQHFLSSLNPVPIETPAF